MRILHVYKDYYPVLGGIENHVRLLAEAQAALGHAVTVLVTDPGPRTTCCELNGVRVIRAARLATVASTPLSLALPRALARQVADVTHLHFPYPLSEAAYLLAGRGRRAVLSYHSDVVRQKRLLRLYAPIMERVMRSVDRIVVATPNYLASSPVLRRYHDKCCIIPYGINRRRFVEADEAAARALRRQLGGGRLLLFVGVLRYYKGVRYLLEAMARLDPRLDARLVIVGDGPEGGALRRQAEILGITGRVVFCGRVPDEALPLYYRAADLFVLPASERSEAFGLVQLEAMSSGLPVLCTELGTGTSYVNQHDASGWVVPPRDADALARAIEKLLSDEALRRRLAAGALARSEQFSADGMVREILDVYRELV
ncbi:MAG TPA: glycosyltransferase [Chloroflexi bacterium]|jgi:glycosyltransferase involved in cell wall biosynthesis|nr:glycosyltransferase [Chloroflexota bacterium]